MKNAHANETGIEAMENDSSGNEEKKDKKDRRQQIVKATLKCISDLGYNNVTMQIISSYSGLSKGAIHHYFKSKGDILMAAFRELDSKLYESVDTKVKKAKSTRDYLSTRIEGPFELISLEGNFFPPDDEGDPIIHLHVILGSPSGEVIGGHLFEAKIFTTAEIIIGKIAGSSVFKAKNDLTGLMELFKK